MGQVESQTAPPAEEPSPPAVEPSPPSAAPPSSSFEALVAEATSFDENGTEESIDVKGSDCVGPFIALQDCIKTNPEAFSKEILEEEENDEEAEKSNLKVRAPSWSREPKPKV